MMREHYTKKLEELHTELIRMGALCEDAISNAVKGLFDDNEDLREKTIRLEAEIDQKESEIENFCLRLLIREQPVAGDLRQINAALKLISNMERIGDQAADIADISAFMKGSSVKKEIHIEEMARAAVNMLNDSVDSFVAWDAQKARDVIAYDDVVDGLFSQIKNELLRRMAKDASAAGDCLDLLMIAKYLERIGDHAENIAEQVLYTITGTKEVSK
jgi:phosphate transport system protein